MPMIGGEEKPRSALATGSLVCGILGFPTMGLTAIPAIITGHMARRSIKRAGEKLGGKGIALAGLITGYLALVVGIAAVAGYIAPRLLWERQMADRRECMLQLQKMGAAFFQFESKYGTLPSDELVTHEPKFSGLRGKKVLEQLEAAGATANVGGFLALPKTFSGDWYYFPPESGSANPSEIVLMSPNIGTYRVALRRDFSVRSLSEPKVAQIDRSAAVAIPAPVKAR